MNQEVTGNKKLLQDLLTLGVGEMIVYGYVNRLGSSSMDESVGALIRSLENEEKIMRFQRKTSVYFDYELIAVGTTRELNERISDSIKRYENKKGMSKNNSRTLK